MGIWRGAACGVALAATVLALGGCGASGSVETVAKIDGWRDQFPSWEELGAYAALEVAYDAETAQQLWDDNVPTSLPDADGTPDGEGRYGSIDGVNFDTHVVALYSSGQSSSCPARLSDVSTSDPPDASVVDPAYTVVETDDSAGSDGACTADYHPYRVVVVIDRDAVPVVPAGQAYGGEVDGNALLELQVSEYSQLPPVRP